MSGNCDVRGSRGRLLSRHRFYPENPRAGRSGPYDAFG